MKSNQPIVFLAVALLCGLGFSESVLSEDPTAAGDGEPETQTATVSFKIHNNLRYCGHDGQSSLCDVYVPETKPPQNGFPTLIAIHGGGWVSGDKWTMAPYARLLAKNGFTVVNINYRHAPKHKFPCQVDDVREALIWAKNNAKDYSIDISRLGLIGYSAGAHLSALIGVLNDEPVDVRVSASEWKKDDQRWKQIPKVSAICAGGAPCEFRTIPEDSEAMTFFLGDTRRKRPETYVAASPASHASADDPAVQFIHGDRDVLVPMQSSQILFKNLKKVGVDTRYETMPKQGHLAVFLNHRTRDKALKFFQDVL